MTTLQFAEAIAASLAERNQFIKLISWNHCEIEENSRPERLAEIQQVTYEAMHLFTICVEKTFPHLSKERAQGFMLDFFTYLYGIACFVSLELVDDSKVDDSSIRNYEPPIVTNQIGYRTNSLKTAVFDGASEERTFDVVNVILYNKT